MKWYQHILKHHKVKCDDCEKEGKIWILFHLILSRWGFWNFDFPGSNEYWECYECWSKETI